MRFRDMCIDLWAPWLTRPRGELRTHTLVGHDKQYVCSSIGVQTYSSRELSQSGACGSNDLLVGYVDINLARCGLRNLRLTTQFLSLFCVVPWWTKNPEPLLSCPYAIPVERPEGASGVRISRLRSNRKCPVERCASKVNSVCSVCSAYLRLFQDERTRVVLFLIS